MVTDTCDRSVLGLFWATVKAIAIVQYNRVTQTMLERRVDAYRWLQNIELIK